MLKKCMCSKNKLTLISGLLSGVFIGYKVYKKIIRGQRKAWFKDKVVLITGASSGIGKEYAHSFAKLGSNLVITARSTEKLLELSEELQEKYNVKVLPITCDVSDEESVKNMISKSLEYFNQIDILINNAGVGSYGYFNDSDLKDMRQIMEINYWGMIYCTKHVLPSMLKRGQGKIINVSSVLGKIAIPAMAVYSSSKFAMNGFSESLRGEVKKYGIDILVVCPTTTKTEFATNAFDSNKFKLGKIGMTSERVAKETINAILDGKKEHILGMGENIGVFVNNLAPSIIDKVMELSSKFMLKE